MGNGNGEEEKELQVDIDDMLGDMIAGDGDSSEEEDVGEEGEEVSDGEEDVSEEEEDEGARDEDEDEGGSEEEEGTSDDDGEEDEDGLEADGDGEESEDLEEEEDKDAIITRLREELSKGKGEGEEEEEVEEEEEEGAFSILGEDDDLDDILDDPKKFNSMMLKALDRYGNLVTKKILTSIPSVVMSQVKQQTAIKSAVDAFYVDNKDLVPFKKLVGATVNQVVAGHPDWTMDKIFNESAKETRKVLGLKKVAKKREGKKNPSFAKPKGKGGKGGEKKERSKLQKDIDSILD